MKKFIRPLYEFSPGSSGSGYVKFLNIPSFNIKNLVAIINQKKSRTIYAIATQGLGYSEILDTTRVVLVHNTDDCSPDDPLLVIYEDEYTPQLVSDYDVIEEGEDAGDSFGVVAGRDQYGKVRPIKTDTAGAVSVKVDGSLSDTTETTQIQVRDNVSAVASQVASLESKIPASLGAKPMANSLSVTFASDANSFAAIPIFIQSINSGTNIGLIGTSATDKTSSAITTTTTTSITPGNTASLAVVVNVTAVSGTNPTYDLALWESNDSGTNYFKVYDFPRITATGSYMSPVFQFSGNRYRLVETIGGTSPSFTRSISRTNFFIQSQFRRQIIDRSVDPNTLNATTAVLYSANTKEIAAVLRMGAITTTAPVFSLEGSEDNSNWFDLGTTITGVASSTVRAKVSDYVKFVRARVSTAGSGATLGDITIKAVS